jgi:hypothetical protein
MIVYRRQNKMQTHMVRQRTAMREMLKAVLRITSETNKAQQVTNEIQHRVWWIVGECIPSAGSHKAAITVPARKRAGK